MSLEEDNDEGAGEVNSLLLGVRGIVLSLEQWELEMLR